MHLLIGLINVAQLPQFIPYTPRGTQVRATGKFAFIAPTALPLLTTLLVTGLLGGRWFLDPSSHIEVYLSNTSGSYLVDKSPSKKAIRPWNAKGLLEGNWSAVGGTVPCVFIIRLTQHLPTDSSRDCYMPLFFWSPQSSVTLEDQTLASQGQLV
jgi:hypothetical protein